MKFLATEYRSDGAYSVHVYADSWEGAEAICEENGWTLDGEIFAEIPASEAFGEKEANELIATLTERDESTNH